MTESWFETKNQGFNNELLKCSILSLPDEVSPLEKYQNKLLLTFLKCSPLYHFL